MNKVEELRIPQKFKDKILHDLKIILDMKIENLEQIILFGSCAREKVTALSDVDIMIVTTTPIENRSIRHELYADICDEWRGGSSDLVFSTIQEREQSHNAFNRFTKEEGIILWERGEKHDSK